MGEMDVILLTGSRVERNRGKGWKIEFLLMDWPVIQLTQLL